MEAQLNINRVIDIKVFDENSETVPCFFSVKNNIVILYMYMKCLIEAVLIRITAYIFYNSLTLLHSERPKLYTILAFLSAIGLKKSQNYHQIP